MPKSSLSWELLARSARRMLAQRFERGATIVGLLGPLAICGWTIARPFDLRQSYHNLLQCLIWLAAWYVLFSLFYAVLVWMRPRVKREGEDLAHLPLPATHFLLLRALDLGLVPVRCLLLTLPLCLIVLAYIGIPYGEQWVSTTWRWFGGEGQLLWIGRVGWSLVNLVTATLLPTVVALAISETVRSIALRIMLLVCPAVGMYALLRLYDEHFRMPYRTDIPYWGSWFMLLPTAVLLYILLGSLMSRRARIVAGLAILLLAAASFTIPRINNFTVQSQMIQRRPAAKAVRSVFNSGAWMAGHVSPPRNIRLLLNRLDSNVMLEFKPLGDRPPYPQDFSTGDGHYSDSEGKAISKAEYDRRQTDYEKASQEYEKAYASQPRFAMWFGAGLMPLLFVLLLFCGLLFGAHRRGFERAEA